MKSKIPSPNAAQAKAPKKTPDANGKPSLARRIFQPLLLPVLAVFTGLVIGAVVIIISDANVIAAYRNFFHDPLAALLATGESVVTAYGALFSGSLGNPVDVVQGFITYFSSGNSKDLLLAFYPLTESLATVTPYIFAGLAVALAYKCGLFNIGAEGQFFVGALASAFIGYSIKGLPWFIHLPLALLAGALAGAIWGAIPGYLKAVAGAHEVVNCIMMNYVAFRLSDWLLNGPMKATGYRPITPVIQASAMLPRFFPDPLRFNWGFILALIFAGLAFWFLFKTTLGLEVRAVGSNPDGARYAGMSVVRNYVMVMALSGGLAGLAGASQVLGIDHWVGQGFSAGYGFDSIAVAMLGQSHPFGVVLAALLFGTLRSGATRMQSMAGIPIDIISIIQGLVIVFVAAPAVIRWLYRIRLSRTEATLLTRGWSK